MPVNKQASDGVEIDGMYQYMKQLAVWLLLRLTTSATLTIEVGPLRYLMVLYSGDASSTRALLKQSSDPLSL